MKKRKIWMAFYQTARMDGLTKADAKTYADSQLNDVETTVSNLDKYKKEAQLEWDKKKE